MKAPLALSIRLMRLARRLLLPLAVSLNLVGWTWLLGASDDLKHQALVASAFILGFALLSGIVGGALSPLRSELRLIPMADYRARRITRIITWILAVLFYTELAIYLVRANGWSETLAQLLELARSIGLILGVAFLISRSGFLRRLRPASIDSYKDLIVSRLIRVVYPLAVLTSLFYVIEVALGYVTLAEWGVRQSLETALIILAAGVLHRFLSLRWRAAVTFMRHEDEEGDEEEGKPTSIYVGVERIGSGVLRIAVFVGTVLALANTWSLGLGAVPELMQEPVIAGWSRTWGDLIMGVTWIVVVYALWWFLRTLLTFIVFPRADTEPGARYATLTVMKYVAYVLMVLTGLNALGVDTSALTVFAGAAGVGLSFGLQDTVANFVSGLIMLVERPVRVGDLIEVGGTQGRVEGIGLRGTIIRTFDRTSVTIPNKQMIGERLINMSYGMEVARVMIEVGVSYDTDPEVVQGLLLGVAEADERVLDDPAPFVRFTAFGESSLDFRLFAYTAMLGDRWLIGHEMRIEVFKALQRAGIEIPFPQRDLHIKDMPTQS